MCFKKKFDKTITRDVVRNFPVKPEKIKDFRNYKYHENFISLRGELPAEVDLTTTGFFTPIKDQGPLGSCSAFGTGAMIEYLWNMSRGQIDLDISELYQYYYTRAIEGKTMVDTGAYIVDAVKCPTIYGFTTEQMFPYDVTQFTTEPGLLVRGSGLWFKKFLNDKAYYEVYSTPENIKQVLADGYPVVFGAKLYESFKRNQNGYVALPNIDTEHLLGGHCMLIVGYFIGADNVQYWKVRNSWGNGFGVNGYCFLSEDFRQQYCFDYYTMRDFK